MHAAIRPYVTAGVALVGASVIAVAPVSPVAPSHIRSASPAVQLTAAPNPIVFYPQVAKDAVSNAGTLLQQYLTVPPALVEALVTQPIPTLVSTLRVFTNPGPYLFVPASLISPIVSGIGATVVAFADVITALVAGNATDFFNAVVDIPARIADGVLNGGYPASGALPISFGGILTPFIDSGPVFIAFPGPIGLPILIAMSILNGIPSSIRSAHVDEPPTPGTATSLASSSPPVDQVLPGVGYPGATPATAGLVTTSEGTTDTDVPATVATEPPQQAEQGLVDATGELTVVDTETPLTDEEQVAALSTTTDVPDNVADLSDGREVKTGQVPSATPDEHPVGVLKRMRQRMAEEIGHVDDAHTVARDHPRLSRAAVRSHSQGAPEKP